MDDDVGEPISFDPLEIIQLVAEDRARSAKIWKNEEIKLYEEAFELEKADFRKKLDQQIIEKKQELLDNIFAQFRNLYNQSSREPEQYVKLNPSKAEKYQYLVSHMTKPKKKKEQQSSEEQNLIIPDLPAYLSFLTSQGVDTLELTLFTEDSFLYHGAIFEQGANVNIICRGDSYIQASLDSICQEEIVFGFNDSTCLRVRTSDIQSGKIRIIPAPS